MVLCCFPSGRLSNDEKIGRYGTVMGDFADNNSKYDISMCQAPCRATCCWIGSMACFCPAQVYMRHKALNHVDPGSGWSNYKCCQGYFCQWNLCESSCPCPCMCLESVLCPGLAATATSIVIRQRYGLGLDEDDVRLIRCSNCLQIFACVFWIVACLTPCEADDQCAQIVDIVADVVFCCTTGCMTAQTHHEINLREQSMAPQRQRMDRY